MVPADSRTPAETGPTLGDTGLRRDIGRIGLIWSCVGSIIGSGWLFGALYAAMAAGAAALLSWIIGGVAAMILALVYAELGAMFPVAGGTARFPKLAFGNVAGASFGWFSWVQAITIAPVEVLAVERYASYWWHGLTSAGSGRITALGYLVALVLMAIFTVVNFFGVRAFAQLNNVLTWFKLAVPALVAVMLLAHIHGGNFHAGGFMFHGIRGVLSALSSGGVMFAYLGFEQGVQFAGESRRPQRDIPWAVIGSVMIAIVLYVLVQFVFVGALPVSLLSNGFGGITNSAILSAPLVGLAGLAGIGWLAFILHIDAVISPAGTSLIYTSSSPRISYGLARAGYLPAAFSKTDSRGVPWPGLIFTFVMSMFFFLPSPTWTHLLEYLTSASALIYAGGPLALGSFRRQLPHLPRPYRMPAADVLGPVAFIVANLIIYWSGWNTLRRLGVALLVGFVVIALTWLFSEQQRPATLEWRSAQWLPVYLVAMGVISRLGTFDGGAGLLPLGWDILVVAALSLVVYYWAIASRLQPAGMRPAGNGWE
jgi:amino acid transporter